MEAWRTSPISAASSRVICSCGAEASARQTKCAIGILRWKMDRARKRFGVYSGGRKNDWDKRIH